ncbi:hypothetical protein AB0F91_43815 [Amycolatopsis sp. NPDC023774]|uniref:helix-turn-helix domain-containing protein n=1 Tax=Amycolatopsis sp. NPDC023774 TaxID=3155015 RepID=UPI0033EEB6EC
MLTIATNSALAEALRHAATASGLQKKYLAQQAQLSRSQLYNLIDPKRSALPRIGDLFSEKCGALQVADGRGKPAGFVFFGFANTCPTRRR